MPLIDALKAVASQLIVLHHLAAYGPLSEDMADIVPGLIGWLYDYGRMAVQVFLVVSGFLAARSLAPRGHAAFDQPLGLLWHRYLRLATPFVAATILAILCAIVARAWMDDDAIPDQATLPQFIAHALLLHGLLDYPALSAGAWYVAVDFQLFALLAATLWLARSLGSRLNVAPLLVAALAVAALFHFNLSPDWDHWGIYFFGSYALGALAYWASERQRPVAWLGAIWTLGIAALMLDFRLRIAVAIAVALILGISRRSGYLEKLPDTRLLAFLGRISYSVFLVHFPIYLVMSALYVRFAPDDISDAMIVLTMGLTWATTLVAGFAFHQLVETRAPGYWPALALRFGSRLVRGSNYR